MVSLAELQARPIALEAWQVVLRPSRVLFGVGRLAELGSLAAELGGRRALVVSDPGVRAAGHVDAALRSLRGASIESAVFDDVAENPTTEHVAAATAAGREHGADLLIGLGGGSALDCAKGANFLLTNGGRMEDYWGFNRAPGPMLPSIGVPCTAGTGSEAQSYALIAQAGTHRKMACGDEKARFSAVLLDPLLPQTAPRAVTAVAGYDALSHAVESLVSRAANPLSRLYSREAWRLLERSYEIVAGAEASGAARGESRGPRGGASIAARGADDALDDAAGAEAWSDMLLGSYLGGAAIEASMLGAAHACANPLTARFAVTHGVAVGLMLPAVVRANAAVAGALYAELLAERTAGRDGAAAGEVGASSAGEALARRLEALREAGGLPARLASVGVGAEALPALAADAREQWTLQHNPRQLGESDLVALYRSVL
jgi:alcohol dehydrogenase